MRCALLLIVSSQYRNVPSLMRTQLSETSLHMMKNQYKFSASDPKQISAKVAVAVIYRCVIASSSP